MNTSLSDDEFDALSADERLLNEKVHVQPPVRWQSKPWQSRDSILVKLSFQSACLIANIIGLVIIALSLSSIVLTRHYNSGNECGLSTDNLLGENIGWHTVRMESEPRFIEADPADLDDTETSSIWTEIYPGSWVWVSEPSKLGFGGGVKLVDYADDPSEFDDTTEGFAVAVMHQLHCVAEMKKSLIEYRTTGMIMIPDEHLDHCVEYLRQAVMCNSDLTLERPENMSFPHGSTGWGDLHRCRNWDQVYEAIRKRSISRSEIGWTKRVFKD